MKKTLLTLLVLAFVSTGFKCGKNSGGLPDEEGVYRGVNYQNKQLRTPAGAIMAAKKDINPAFGPLVDAGLEDLRRIAAAPPNNYDVSNFPSSRWKIWFMPRSNRCENAAFLVDASGSPYEGSQWDKNPDPNICWVCAAGMMVHQGIEGDNPGMVITDDMGVMRTIVRYEAEHSILFYLDPPRYNATQYHTSGGHPILGEGPPVEAVALTLPVNITAGDRIAATKGQLACVLVTK